MAWSSIIAQERVKNVLQKAIVENRVAHAYCFWGPPGIGKDALALEFAKTLNCESPTFDGDTARACDQCKSCQQAQNLQHPNIQFMFALPAVKSDPGSGNSSILKLSDDQITVVQEQLRLKSQDPYHKIAIPNARHIRIASVRDIKKSVSMSASQRGRRFVIVSEAETMNTEAANAFLKTLEEPAANLTIILTASRRDQLLTTILSRCQQIRCDTLPDDAIAQELQRRLDVPADEAALISRLADGSFARARELLQDDLKELRQDVVALLRTVLKGRNYILLLNNQIERITADRNKTKIEKMLTLLLLWIRDAHTLLISNNTGLVTNIDQIDDIRNFIRNFPNADFAGAALKIEETLRLIKGNVQSALALIRLSLQLRSLLANRTA